MKTRRFAHVLPVICYFFTFVWLHRKSYFVLIGANIVLRSCSPFINIILPKYVIDELMGRNRLTVIAWYVAALVGANFVLYLLNNLRDYHLRQANVFLEMKLDEVIGRKAMEMDFAYTENPQTLTQLEKAKTGVSWYSGGIGGLCENLVVIVSSLLTLSGTLYILSRLTPWLIGLLLAIVLLNMVVVSAQQKMNVQFMKDLVGINRRFSYYFGLLSNFKYGKDIRLYSAAAMLMKRVDIYIREEWGIQWKQLGANNRYTFLLTLLGTLQQALLYGYLGLLVVARAITIGEFQMLISAARTFTNSLSGMVTKIIDLGKNTDFMNEYKLFMEYPSAMASGEGKPVEAESHVLEVCNVSFKYPGSDCLALRNVSLTIPSGQRLAVVGPNGAGKTTLIKLLTRLYEPTTGCILLDGKDIRGYELEEYRRLFSVIFQDFKLMAFSIRDNITAGARENVDIMNGAVERSIDNALELVGLKEKVTGLPKGLDTPIYRSFDKDGIELSGGESQKMAIVRAIFKDAPIVVLDEPTAALDPVAEFEIYNHFDNLVGNKTAIYISHRLSSCRFCEKIGVFADGELVEYGDHNELSRSGGLYSQMWQAQAKWYVSAQQRSVDTA